MTRVGVAELKASLSAYLARVKAGEVVTVTHHGRPIARLVPLSAVEADPAGHLAALERLGLVRAGGVPIDEAFWALPRPDDPDGRSLALLLAEREEGT